MRDLDIILKSVEETNDKYRTLGVSFTQTQSELLRDYDCAFFDLTEHRIEAHDYWIDVYNSAKGSNAAKEKVADSEVRILYKIRQTMTAIKIRIDALRSNISANKKQ